MQYQATQYLAGGSFTHGGDVETHYDYPPYGTNEAWDHTEQLWTRDEMTGEWTPDGVENPVTVDWEGLLDEFGPVNDEPPGVYSCQPK